MQLFMISRDYIVIAIATIIAVIVGGNLNWNSVVSYRTSAAMIGPLLAYAYTLVQKNSKEFQGYCRA